MLRIAQVPLKYPPALGGVEKVAAQQCRILADAGHQVTVFTTQYDAAWRPLDAPAEEVRDGIRVRRFTGRWLRGLKYPLVPGLAAALQAADADVLHAHSFWYHNLLAAQRARRARRLPLIIQPHFDWKRSWFHTPYRVLLGRRLLQAELVICVSRFEADLLRTAGLPYGRMAVLPNAVDLREFAAPAPRPAAAATAPYAGRPYLLSVGRVSEGKGSDLLLALAARLRDERAAEFVLVAGPDGGGLAAAQRAAARDGLGEYIVFAGALPRAELLALFAHARAYVHASRAEAFGIVLAEALAAGLPVIAPRAFAAAEIVSDGENGLLYPPDDAGALAGAVRQLRDAGRRTAMAAAARAAAARFDLVPYGRHLLELYAAVVSG